MPNSQYELKRSSKGQYHFILKANNGDIILSSEMYASKTSTENAIASVQANSSNAVQYEVKATHNSKPYFVLKTKNHQVIGTSQMYFSESAAKNGVDAVIKSGATTRIHDLSTKC